MAVTGPDLGFSFQGIYVTRVSEGGPAEIAGLQIGDKIMQVTNVPKEETSLKYLGVGASPASWLGGTYPSPWELVLVVPGRKLAGSSVYSRAFRFMGDPVP